MKYNNKYKGYIGTGKIGGQFVPHRIQNMIIRTYAKKHDWNFLFSFAEYYMDECYMMLHSVLEELQNQSGLIFYSTHLLPTDRLHRKKIFNTIFNKKCSLHFALEELDVFHSKDIGPIEDIMLTRSLAQHIGSSSTFLVNGLDFSER